MVWCKKNKYMYFHFTPNHFEYLSVIFSNFCEPNGLPVLEYKFIKDNKLTTPLNINIRPTSCSNRMRLFNTNRFYNCCNSLDVSVQ